MRKDKLLRRVEEYLAKPSEDDLRKLISSLRTKLVPPCPRCGSMSTVRYGFHSRKAGKVQQYRCNTCRYVYTDATADRKRGMEAHPTCPRCGSRAMKRGFWRWTRKDGTKMSEQRYQCTNPRCRYYFKKRESFRLHQGSLEMQIASGITRDAASL